MKIDQDQLDAASRWAGNGLKIGSFIAGLMLPIAAVVVASQWLLPSNK